MISSTPVAGRARALKIGALVAVAAALAVPAKADLIFSGTGTDSDGSAISATVDFSLSGNTFQVVITNNAVANSQASVLTNLGFNTVPAPATALPSSSGSAALTSGSSLVGVASSQTIGQNWAYLSGGAASSGFGVGTGDGNLCGSAGCGVMLDGSAFGLVGTGTDLTQDGLPTRTYIENSITIDITLAANSTFTLSDITTVNFQYGTSPGEGSISVPGCTGGSDCGGTPVPEPGSLALIGAALGGLGLILRRRVQHRTA